MDSRMSTSGISHLDHESQLELGYANYGCSHYKRRCKILAPCCDKVFDCRHCHNESQNSIEVDPVDRHDIPRHDLKRVRCHNFYHLFLVSHGARCSTDVH